MMLTKIITALVLFISISGISYTIWNNIKQDVRDDHTNEINKVEEVKANDVKEGIKKIVDTAPKDENGEINILDTFIKDNNLKGK